MERPENLLREFNIQSPELVSVLGFMGSVFEELSQDSRMSAMLAERNIRDSLSDFVGNTLENPLDSAANMLDVLESKLSEIIHTLPVKFFKKNNDIIENVYKAKNTGSLLHYSIILKDETPENKKLLRDFINDYNTKPYASRFPIIFQDIPTDILPKFKKELKSGNFELVKYEKVSGKS